jgi:hypothetical protein
MITVSRVSTVFLDHTGKAGALLRRPGFPSPVSEIRATVSGDRYSWREFNPLGVLKRRSKSLTH